MASAPSGRPILARSSSYDIDPPRSPPAFASGPSHSRSYSLSYAYSYPYPSPLHTRSSTLTSLIRTRSQQSLQNTAAGGARPGTGMGDEEAAVAGSSSPLPHARLDLANDEIERLLRDEARLSKVLNGPMARSMKLIGKSNQRHRWESYWKSEEELRPMRKPIREYYERTNSLIQQYLYIDRLLDSSIPHDLLNEYGNELEASTFRPVGVPDTISEEESQHSSPSHLEASASPHGHETAGSMASYGSISDPTGNSTDSHPKTAAPFRRMPKDIFLASENLPLLQAANQEGQDVPPLSDVVAQPVEKGPEPRLPWLEDVHLESDSPVVTLAIWVNLIANIILLVGKIIVVLSVPSMSVLASLVDAVLDLLSTAIVWTTTRLISAGQRDQYSYPIGRSRLEPLGVLVFSVIIVTSFFQVSLESIQRLAGPEREILQLSTPALIIMVGTIVIKGACWLWTRLVKNSSVRALADDAKTDVIFNFGSILFPIVGFYGQIWWLDAFGGLLLSLFVILVWGRTSAQHIRNLTGFSAEPDERNLLLYLIMRFATAIRQIQNLRAYHAGDKLVVEVDIILSANTPLKDSHDLSEVLTYFLESVPIVDRAFVHVDYLSYNAPTHMLRQSAT